MKLYHGSNMPIHEIDLSKSNRGKDFGRGFYLSDNYEQAYRMACLTAERQESGMPEVSVFEVVDDFYADESLKILRFDAYSEEWADFVLSNRRNMAK